MLEIDVESIPVQVLVGGKGVHLLEVTKGKIPKSLVNVIGDQTILDLVMNKTKKQGFKRFIYSLGLSKGCFGIDIYKHLLNRGLGVECTFEYYGNGNAKSIQNLIELTDYKYPIFVLCPDMLLPWDAMKLAVSMHKHGTFTWVTSSAIHLEMDRYNGLKVREDGAVIYDSKVTSDGSYLDTGGLKTVTKAGAIIVDPNLLVNTISSIESTRKTVGEIDIFWDVIPFLERINWQRLDKGESSLINAVIGTDPVMDIGTPDRLKMVKKYLNDKE